MLYNALQIGSPKSVHKSGAHYTKVIVENLESALEKFISVYEELENR